MANLALISIVIQTIAYFFLVIGVIYIKRNNIRKHKITTIIATLVNSSSLFIVMLPSFYSFISAKVNSILSITIVIHHSFGLAALVMASLVVFRPCQWIRKFWSLKKYMIVLFIFWTVAYFLGIVVYLMLYF